MGRREEISDVAASVPFDNTTNGFTVDNVQEAIEEARLDGSIFNGIDAGVFKTTRVLTAYNSAGGQVITTTPSTIQINTPTGSTDLAAFQITSGQITFRESGKYSVYYYVAFDNVNGTRTNTQSFLEINTGSGFSKIQASDVYTYERTSNADRQTGTGVLSLAVTSGTIIRIRSQIIQGSNNSTLAEACKVHIIPFDPETCQPNFTIDGSDLTNLEILGQINAGEL